MAFCDVDKDVMRVTRRVVRPWPVDPSLPCREFVPNSDIGIPVGGTQLPLSAPVESGSRPIDRLSFGDTLRTSRALLGLTADGPTPSCVRPLSAAPLVSSTESWVPSISSATTTASSVPSVPSVSSASVSAVPVEESAAKITDADPWARPAWVAVEKQEFRRQHLQLNNPQTLALIDACEFVSLGGYCGAAFSLQSLGLKKFTYPFDWVRAPVEGVIQCVEDKFNGFFTYKFIADEGGHQLFGSTQWGGSFWHHDPRSAKVKFEFERRVDRFYGKRHNEAPSCKPRIFVRIANSSREICSTLRLHRALKCALPEAKVRLLVIIDLQRKSDLVCLQNIEDVLFCRVHAKLFANPDCHFAAQMLANTEAYSEAVARALRHWSGHPSSFVMAPNVESLVCDCDQYDGGDPAKSLYAPRLVA